MFRHAVSAPSESTMTGPIVIAAVVIDIKTPRMDGSLFMREKGNGSERKIRISIFMAFYLISAMYVEHGAFIKPDPNPNSY